MGMHLPHLQVTQETWDLANQLAGLTESPFESAFTGILELWRWGLKLGPDTEPPQGICESPLAVDRMATVMRWKGDRKRLVDVLVDLGLVAILSNGLRVRGMRRYWPAWRKNHRDMWDTWAERNPEHVGTPTEEPPDGDSPAPARSPGGKRAVQAPQTQTQTQTQEKQLPAPPAPRVGKNPTPADDPEFIAFFAQAQDDRTAVFPESIPEPPPRKSWDQWAEFKAKVPDPQRRRDTWCAYLADPHARKTNPVCCWALFASQPHKYVPGQNAQAPPPDERPPCSACGRPKETAVFRGRRLCYACAAAGEQPRDSA